MKPDEAYRKALEDTLQHEGGWYDGKGKHDPNPTMKGVTQNTYDDYRQANGLPLRTVRNIEESEVLALYRKYWTSASLEEVAAVAPITAMCLFDMSINAGPGTAVKILQRALGVVVDGKCGPKTLEALKHSALDYQGDFSIADDVCFERLRYYADLAKSSKHRPSLLSWTIRVLKFREKYLK